MGSMSCRRRVQVCFPLLSSTTTTIMFTYDGRGGVHRGNNGNSSPTKSQGYLFNSGRRRNHGHGHGNRHQHQHHHHHQHQHQHHGQSHANGPVLQTNDAPEPVRPPNAHADKLINLLKTSGEYDRLRKQIFSTFQNSVRYYSHYSILHLLMTNRTCARFSSLVSTVS